MKDYLDQSISKYSSIKALIITGGECFTIGKDLISIIKYATKKKLSTRIVTNAFWAKTFKQAYKKLLPLSMVGLKEINFSTGDEHQKWVPSDNIIYATVASIKLNFRVAINVEKQNYTQFSSLSLTEDPRLKKYINNASGQSLTIVESIWMPFTKSTEKKINCEKKDLLITLPYKRCTSLFKTIAINPKNQMYSCCGLTVDVNPFLNIGNVAEFSIDELYNNQFNDFLKIWLYTEGPQKILEYIFDKGKFERFSTENWHICQICIELFRNNQYLEFLRNNYEEVYSNIMLKYIFLRKCKL